MPDILLANEDDVCYKAKVGGTDIYFFANETLEYMGNQILGSDLYALLTRTGI